MKQSYEEAKLELLIFTGEDVITTSPDSDDDEREIMPFN